MESEPVTIRKQGAPVLVSRVLGMGLAAALLLLSAAAVLAAALGVDAWLGYRKMVGGNRDERIEHVHGPHPTLGWAPLPGIGIHESPGNFSVRYGIDAGGLRRVDNPAAPKARLWLFGDSFTFGHGVRDEETYASVMAREWLVPGLAVRNAGVMGYGIAQQLQRLIELEERIHPGDRVVFAPVSVDIERSLKHFAHPSKALFRKEKGAISVYPDWQDGHLVTADFDTPANRLRALLYNARFTGRGLRRLHHALSPPGGAAEALAMIEAARAITRARHARFALLFLPQPRECLMNGYRVDLSAFEFPDLKRFFPDDLEALDEIRFPHDPHWNARGHELAARAVVEALRAEGVLSRADLVDDPDLPVLLPAGAAGRVPDAAGRTGA